MSKNACSIGLERLKQKNPNGFLAIVTQKGCKPCLPRGSEIITENGLVPIEDIKTGDLVLTHTGKFRPVTQTMSREYEGELVKVRSSNTYIASMATPDHPFLAYEVVRFAPGGQPTLASLAWVQAGHLEHKALVCLPVIAEEFTPTEITNEFIFNQPVNKHSKPRFAIGGRYARRYVYPDGTNIQRIDVRVCRKESLLVNVDLMVVIGFYLAEGFVDLKHRYVGFTFGKNLLEYGYAFELKASLERLGISASVVADAGGCRVFGYSMKLGRILSKEFGRKSYGKRVPRWVLELPRSLLEQLFMSYINGDGSDVKGKADAFEASTGSRALAHAFQLIGLKLGYLSGIKTPSEAKSDMIMGRQVNLRPQYHMIFYRPTDAKSRGRLDSRYLQMSIRSIGRVAYHGPVYNLAVHIDESYCTAAHIVHNCTPMKKMVKKSVGKAMQVVEIPVEDVKCDPIIDKLRITESPSVLFFKGKTVKRISDGDKTDDQIRAQIAVIMGKKK